MRYLVLFLQGLFIVGLVGCCVTIPMAAWGYFSVLFKKDTEADTSESEIATD